MVLKDQAYNDANNDPYECPGCGRKEEAECYTDSEPTFGLFCSACKRYL